MNPPQTDLDSAPFWSAVAEHRVVVQRCEACERARFGRLGSCPYCGTLGGVDVDLTGEGVVYSFVRARRALTADMAGEVPYTIGTIQLDDGDADRQGPRMLGRVDPCDDVVIGARVRPTFFQHDTWTELRFEIIS